MDRRLKIVQVMELTGLGRSTIYAAMKRGDFAKGSYKFGRRTWAESVIRDLYSDADLPDDHSHHGSSSSAHLETTPAPSAKNAAETPKRSTRAPLIAGSSGKRVRPVRRRLKIHRKP